MVEAGKARDERAASVEGRIAGRTLSMASFPLMQRMKHRGASTSKCDEGIGRRSQRVIRKWRSQHKGRIEITSEKAEKSG